MVGGLEKQSVPTVSVVEFWRVLVHNSDLVRLAPVQRIIITLSLYPPRRVVIGDYLTWYFQNKPSQEADRSLQRLERLKLRSAVYLRYRISSRDTLSRLAVAEVHHVVNSSGPLLDLGAGIFSAASSSRFDLRILAQVNPPSLRINRQNGVRVESRRPYVSSIDYSSLFVRPCPGTWSLTQPSSLGFSYNRYLAVAARAVRRSLKDDKRLIAERRGDTDLRFAKWTVSF